MVQADVLLSLNSLQNLQALPVGQLVTFQVQLTGLPAGEQLDSLAATVHYTSSLLGAPTVHQGAIIPQPVFDPQDFLSDASAGVADATFLTAGLQSAYHIGSNGVSFSFDAQVLQAGTGHLSFDFVDASQFNSADPNHPFFFTPATGSALDFTAVVPEPSAWILLGTAFLAVTVYGLKRRVVAS
jgi:hypothetical protein